MWIAWSVLLLAGLLAAAISILFLITLWLRYHAQGLVPPAGELLRLPSGPLHVVELGKPSAPAVLLIHGLGGNLLNLTHGLAPILATSCRVVAVDRAGSGYSPAAQSDEFLTAQASQLSELLDSRAISEAVVVGHSLGAAVALSLASLRPDKVRGVALITPIVVRQSVPPVFQGLVINSAAVRRVMAWTIAIPLSALRANQVLGQFFNPETVPADYGTKAGGYLGLRPEAFIETSAELVHLIQETNGPHWELSRTIPVAALFASDDAVLDPQMQSEGLTASIPGSRAQFVVGAGHMLPVTRPAVCAAFVDEMVRETLGPSAPGSGTSEPRKSAFEKAGE